MKRNSILAIVIMLLCSSYIRAQEYSSSSDSVIVMGTVVDHLTGVPQPYCRLHFIQGADTAATLLCDNEGFFLSEGLSTGSYTLSVTLRGQQVYKSDLVLNDNAALHIAIITDSFSFRKLKPVEVTAMKSQLGYLLIDSPDDVRLWDMNGNMGGDASSKRSCDPNNPENLIGASLWFFSPGLEVSWKGSTMKNEILLYGRVLDTKRPAKADTATTAKEKR